MALRHLAAARRTGIGITLLPSLYRHGGIFGRDPVPGQRRFLNDLEPYLRIVEACRAATAGDPQAAVGMAPHSLRAVTPEMLQAVAALPGPIHIHAAEQAKEVAECLAATGARPVQWLLDNAPVDARWCLIHATHMNAAEMRRAGRDRRGRRALPLDRGLARRRHLPAARTTWRPAAGYGIGTDSHVGVSPRDELRQLETSQRLALPRTRGGDDGGIAASRPAAARRGAGRRRAGQRPAARRHRAGAALRPGGVG